MPTRHYHYMLYKPYGYISQFTSQQKNSHKKKFLGELYPFAAGSMAIGRLDENSEGLLLLTTHGKVSAAITSKKFEKEYYALVDGLITAEAILALQNGVTISIEGKQYLTKPCKAESITPKQLPETTQKIRDDRHGPTSWVAITLREGKFRQVRKMTAAVGFPTLRLVRVRVGQFTIKNMTAGDVVEIDTLPL